MSRLARICATSLVWGLVSCATTATQAPLSPPAPLEAEPLPPAPPPPLPPPEPQAREKMDAPDPDVALIPAASLSVSPPPVEPPPVATAPAGGEVTTIPAATNARVLPVAYAGDEPCRRALTGSSPVAEACRREGRPGGRAVMKEMVRGGWAAGLALTCDDCHVDRADLAQLTPEASQMFAKLLATFGSK